MLTDVFRGSSRILVGRIISLGSSFCFCEALNKSFIQLKNIGFYKAFFIKHLKVTISWEDLCCSLHYLFSGWKRMHYSKFFSFIVLMTYFVSPTQCFSFCFFKQLSQSNIMVVNRLVMMAGVYLKVMCHLVNLFSCSVAKTPPWYFLIFIKNQMEIHEEFRGFPFFR